MTTPFELEEKTFRHPVAPAQYHDPSPKFKDYTSARPNDFESFRSIPARSGLIRLIVGRIITADGHDMHDDYTVPIESHFLKRPLAWILKYTYCPARGIPAAGVDLHVKFMLAEAQAGLGWMDVSKSPYTLQLKDSDIIEVLVTRQKKGSGPTALQLLMQGSEEDLARRRWSPSSWKEASAFLAETKPSNVSGADEWLPKVWGILEKFAEDDNVTKPGLELLLAFVKDGSSDRLKRVAADRDGINIIQRILELHSGNAAVQTIGWGLLAELAKEPTLQPLLVQRGGARALARRCEREASLGAASMSAITKLLGCLENVPGSDKKSSALIAIPTEENETQTKIADPESQGSSAEKKKLVCMKAVVKIERAIAQSDVLAIDKTLRQLTAKMKAQDVDVAGVQASGLGPLLGELTKYEGDADIRHLSKGAILQVAKLQNAEPVR